MRRFTMLCSVVALGIATPATAGIKGTINFQGAAPAPKAVDMSSDPKCKKLAPKAKTNDVLVKGGKLANVFGYIKNAPKKKYKSKEKVQLDQKNCRYSPKVFGVLVKQKVQIKNSDPTLHNVHAFAKRGEFNQAMPTQGQVITKKFKKAQIMVPIKCDVHAWMAAHVGVMEHPFFGTSNESGVLEIPTAGLPDGDYEIATWHETLGKKSAKVKVSGGQGSFQIAYSK